MSVSVLVGGHPESIRNEVPSCSRAQPLFGAREPQDQDVRGSIRYMTAICTRGGVWQREGYARECAERKMSAGSCTTAAIFGRGQTTRVQERIFSLIGSGICRLMS